MRSKLEFHGFIVCSSALTAPEAQKFSEKMGSCGGQPCLPPHSIRKGAGICLPLPFRPGRARNPARREQAVAFTSLAA